MFTAKTANIPAPYGSIVDYKTGRVIRVATREDWSYARLVGAAQTGAHRDSATGTDALTVFCDGPDADPE